MANAIRRISIARGYDARDYALNCFGGAGGQHACLVADSLGIATILIHPLSGLLSAYGLKRARLRALKQRSINGRLAPELMHRLVDVSVALSDEAKAELRAQGAEASACTARAHLRYEGSDTTLPVRFSDCPTMMSDFAREHARRFGFGFEGRAIAVDSIEAEAESGQAMPGIETGAERTKRGGPLVRSRFYSQGNWHAAPLYSSADLASKQKINGPALLIEPHQTIVVEPGWTAEMRESRMMVLTRAAPSDPRLRVKTEGAPDPVALEVFANLFMAIAEDMGVVLQNTATSVNIKERLDFSCAIFDTRGGLVANAPHMPVHLGSMGDCVTAVMRKHPEYGTSSLPRAATTPISAASHRVRCRPSRKPSQKKAFCSTASASFTLRSSMRPPCAQFWQAAAGPLAIPNRTSPI
jgi:5-oxoprolinase (ATP-hydrolysing)